MASGINQLTVTPQNGFDKQKVSGCNAEIETDDMTERHQSRISSSTELNKSLYSQYHLSFSRYSNILVCKVQSFSYLTYI